MKKALIFLFILNFISCSTSKVKSKETVVKTTYKGLKIAKITKIIDGDTVTFNELRFHKINSALETMKSMYLDYGKWNKLSKGLHQDNINRKVWENIKLFENDEVYTIIADGTETMDAYYACLIVFDSNDKDCLEENHPSKNKIINLFYERMNENRAKKINYFILR